MDFLMKKPGDNMEIREIFDLLSICFPKMSREYFVRRILKDPGYETANTLIMTVNNRIVSHAQIFDKKISWNNRGKARFLGLGFICTRPEYRGRGYATKLLRKITNTNDDCIFGLFTKIPDYYKKLGFKPVPRKKIIIKKSSFVDPPDSCLKIRRFKPGVDLSRVRFIHKACFDKQPGIIARSPADWKAQLSYFNEERKLFLVAELNGKIVAYIRSKLIKPSKSKIEIVEYASSGNQINTISDFMAFLFNKCGITEVKGWKKLLLPALGCASAYKEEIDTKMMLKLNGKYKRDNISKKGLCFLESDGF